VEVKNNMNNASQLKNIESPFTELFSLLKRYDIKSQGFTNLLYETEELKAMQQHVANAIEILLHGMQGIGRLMGGSLSEKKEIIEELQDVGFFISSISNLTEALNSLRSDTDYELKQRSKINS
jgi:hypothetical protein